MKNTELVKTVSAIESAVHPLEVRRARRAHADRTEEVQVSKFVYVLTTSWEGVSGVFTTVERAFAEIHTPKANLGDARHLLDRAGLYVVVDGGSWRRIDKRVLNQGRGMR